PSRYPTSWKAASRANPRAGTIPAAVPSLSRRLSRAPTSRSAARPENIDFLMITRSFRGRLPCGGRSLDLSRPQVMGILNVTPDSFSDGGCYSRLDAALRHAEAMVRAGATLIDIGG